MSEKDRSAKAGAAGEKAVDMSKYEGHFALSGKNKGTSGEFLGKICLVGFLVNDRSSSWSDEDIDKMKTVLRRAAETIKEQSGLSDNRLKISYAFDVVPVQYRYERDEYKRVVDDVLVQYGYKDAASYKEHYEKKFKKTEAPLIFFVNRDFRSFALMDTSEAMNDGSSEYCFVSYSNDTEDCIRALIHELMHQFGAIDYYLPEKVKSAARKIFPESIMLHGLEIDDLTRYLIGWDREPTGNALKFLDEIAGVTEEEIKEAREKDKENDW